MLGMHRSGTSYLAGSFGSAGYFIGDESSLMGPGPDNPRGFFERRDVCRLNDRLLAGVGASWHSPPDPSVVRVHRPRMTAEIGALFGAIAEDASGNPIVMKDPRLSLLLPAWDAVCGDELVNVLVTRNPLDIAASLQRRNAFPVHFSLALWQLYSVSLLNALHGRFVLVAHFDQLAQSREERSRWTQDAGRELRRLGLPFPDLDGFAASDKHFRSRADELFELASPDQLRLWRFLQELEAVEQHLSVPQEFLQWPTSTATLVLEVAGLIGESAGFSRPHQTVGPESDPINPDDLALTKADIERLRADLVDSERERDVLMAESAAAVRAAEEAAAVSSGLAAAAERRVDEISEALLQSETTNDRVIRQLKKELDSLYSEAGEENLRLQGSLRDEVARREAAEAALHALSGELVIVRSRALETESRVSELERSVVEFERSVADFERSVAEASQVNAELHLALDAAVSADTSSQQLLLESERRVSDLTLACAEIRESLIDAHVRMTDILREREVESARAIRLSAEVGKLRSSLHEAELQAVEGTIAAEQVLRLTKEAESLRVSLSAAHSRANAAQNDARLAESRLAEVEREAQLVSEHFTLTLASIVNSRSWRLTRPMRALFRLSRGGKPRGA